MIFVTIGTQAPFDRLIKAIDEIAPKLEGEKVIAQTVPSRYKARNIQTVDFLSPDEFDNLFSEAKIIVSHAGMGTIISALTKGKPIMVMPRIASLGEHRNEHQLATAKKMSQMGYVKVVSDKNSLYYEIHEVLKIENKFKVEKVINDFASERLLASIRGFIRDLK